MNDIELKQKRLELLNETVAHFNSNNRAAVTKNCFYTHDFNGGCAIGRKCSAELAEKLEYIGGGIANPLIFVALPEGLKELGIEFLVDLQQLHDYIENWNEKGLSDCGKSKYEYIVKTYCI